MSKKYNVPPNWPAAPEGWTPPPNWKPDPNWGPAPDNWDFWTNDEGASEGYGYAENVSGDKPASTKSWFARHKVLTTIGALILVSVFVNAVSDDGESSDASAETVTTESAKPSPIPETAAPTPSAEPTTPEATQPPAPVVEPELGYGSYPADEQAFIDAFEQGKTRYNEAETELQRSVALTERDTQMCGASGNGSMVNWTGKIVEIGANNDGLAHVKIELANGVKVQTWNNALSDISDNTLIPQSAPFFGTLSSMGEDTLVTFTAESVASDTSCLTTTNLTQAFSAVDPNFLVRFSDVRPQ
ncbi:hypothetical protein KKR91_03670 [Arthrobacter jiangjiafuii]|uniref:Uncharacterized protein n=1 Tax=Arthrobacter jiangjiafuii TaxID=2817475 RepID=A0A975M6A6_9MICC|nr:hypothetical protein [Arthrobacter jiangjiafuii]MBP3043703.1 hypothetical protein [Arthrobacter jiangjiafuii]QWC10735.1 hypothetical protein KKR91_03670 [Arthrobacter jiangjiafuii]